jgi:hypothetical protein
MSQSTRENEITLKASEAFTAKYYVAQMDSSGDAEMGEGATDLLLGICQNEPADGENALIRIGGTSKAVAGGSISIGDWVTSHTDGTIVATTTDKQTVIGRALEEADSGDIIEIMLTHFTLDVA